jgi:8-hydroxy-5-deazaflavin:NADPH oxidoreductase
MGPLSPVSVEHQVELASPHVVKALNSIFGGVLADDSPLDAFFAGDRFDLALGTQVR